MKSLTQLIKANEDAASLVRKMQAVRDKFKADSAPIAGNAKLNPDYIRDTIKALQDAALSQFGQPMNTLNSLISTVNSDLAFWRSVPYVLSRQPFVRDDAALENATRLRWCMELAKAPGGLLALMFLDAVNEKNWPLVFAVWSEADARDKPPAGIDLASLPPIPEQQQALALIAKILATTGQAHAFVGQITGRRIDSPLADVRAQVPTEIAVSLNFEMPQLARKPDVVAEQVTGTPAERMSAHRASVGAAG
jgi:hypothetical protein